MLHARSEPHLKEGENALPHRRSRVRGSRRGVRPGHVVILKGSPGVGKSYVARKLTGRLPSSKRALISIDELLHVDQRPLGRDKLRLAKFHAAIMTRSFLREGFDIIIEYTFDIPEDLAFLIDKLTHSHSEELHPCSIHVIHLSAPYEKVIRRNAHRRDGSDPMNLALLRKLYKRCEATAGLMEGEQIIDTGAIGVHKVLDAITERLRSAQP